MAYRRLAWLLIAGALAIPACGGDEFSEGGAGTAGQDAGLGGAAGGGTGGTAGSAGQSECPAETKLCEGACVGVSDPAYGCSLSGCDPCQLPYAVAACAPGCSVTSCNPGFDDCNPSEPGCETSLNLPSSCGSCTNACDAGQLCDAPNCVSDCGTKTQCGDSCVDLQTDVLNCNSCGNVCPSAPANATVKCDAGNCSFECETGFADCTGADGCETNLSSNPLHCGACNAPCAQAPAGAQAELCTNMQCGCGGGRSPCPVSGKTACVRTHDDPKFCGPSCQACSAGEMCASSQCQTGKCAWGLADCSGTCVSLQSNPAHCGSCGNSCSTGQFCKGGQCVSFCSTAQCADATLLGHCPNISTDAAHCGACGSQCSPGEACVQGTCQTLEFAREPWECGSDKVCNTPSWPVIPAPLYCVSGNFCPLL